MFSISLLSLASFIVIAFIKMCWLEIELVNPYNSASDLEASFNASRIFGVFLTYLKSVLYFSIFKKARFL